MSDKMKIFCVNRNEYLDVEGGTSLARIAADADIRPDGMTPICAWVNNKTEPMGYTVYRPKRVEFLSRLHPAGERVYIRSLCMLLYTALRHTFPGWRLRIEHSMGGGMYCRLFRIDEHGREIPMDADRIAEACRTIEAEMVRLRDLDLPFSHRERPTADVLERFAAQDMPDKATLLSGIHELYTTYYRLDDTIDYYYSALAPSTGLLTVFGLVPYRDGGFLLMSFDRSRPDTLAPQPKQEKMYQAYLDYKHFNRVIGIASVGQLNEAIEAKRATELINLAEAMHDKKISAIAADIARRYEQGGARIILVAGPSSSGKTTTAKRLGIALMTNLLKPQIISLDNYFVNRVDNPRDATGDYDYESIHALRLDAFNADLQALLAGEEVAMPTYNFETGTYSYRGDTLRLTPNSVLLIEGIHGLNPALTSAIDESQKYRVYVSALTSLAIDDHNWISTTDNRLLRRIIRDYKYRGSSAQESIRRWPSVRRGEERWIFPYQENADATFNSSLLFELAVIKDYAEAILRAVPNDAPEYAEAYRLRRFLSYFHPIDDRSIPSTSLLREFLGGSSFHY